MTYKVPESRRPAVRAVLDAIERAERVILTTHLNADGDGTGSQAALLSLLAASGAEAWIVNPTPFPDLYRFLIPDPTRILPAGGEEARQQCAEADLCIVVDTGEKSRIGRVKPMVEALPKVVVDHHPPGEDALEGISFRDSDAAAAGELVFDLVWSRSGPWDRPVVEGLYVALLTDTGSFRFSNSSPGAHRVAAEVIARGASPDRLHRRVYGQVPIRRIKLLERALPNLEVSPGGSVAWMTVPSEAFRELACTSEDLEGMVDYPRGLEGVEVGMLFREVEPGQVKVSFRSNGAVDVNLLAREFQGGGHVRASGAMVRGASLPEVRDRVTTRAIRMAEDAQDQAEAELSESAPELWGGAGVEL